MTFAVRTACVSDVSAMHRVRNSVRENRLSDPQRISEASYLPYVAAGSAWVAETDAGLVGFAAVDARSESVWALFIDPSAEGAGLGRALHRQMLDWAHEQGIGRLTLTTDRGTRAAEFYRRAGWMETGLTADGELLFEMPLASTITAADNPLSVRSSIEQLWARYRAVNPDAPAEAPAAFHFCDNQTDADICAALVLEGRKRATAPSLAELRMAGEVAPKPGDLAIITNWAGEAKAVIRTWSVELKRFSEVDESFARAEGEGDGTLAWWRTAHKAYYERLLAGTGETVDDNLEIVCERFELVFPV